MKRVLGIVVSERRLGNTELLVREILDGISEQCIREMLRLTDLQIGPCKACYRCLEPGSACRLKDDFNFVLEKIMEADALVIGLPVYFLGPHAGYKMLTDRMLGAGHYSEHTRGKPCAVVIPYGMQGWEGYARAAALVLPRVLQMKVVECWQVHATLPGEGVMSRENREYAKQLGRNLLTGLEYEKRQGECPFCGSDIFRLLPEGEVECPLCSARGLVNDGVPEFLHPGLRFSAEGLHEHFNVWLPEMRQKYLKERDRLKEIQKLYRGTGQWINND